MNKLGFSNNMENCANGWMAGRFYGLLAAINKYSGDLNNKQVWYSNGPTSLEFKRLICVPMSNGLVFKWWSENQTKKTV